MVIFIYEGSVVTMLYNYRHQILYYIMYLPIQLVIVIWLVFVYEFKYIDIYVWSTYIELIF